LFPAAVAFASALFCSIQKVVISLRLNLVVLWTAYQCALVSPRRRRLRLTSPILHRMVVVHDAAEEVS
jgi:hypothetical protein